MKLIQYSRSIIPHAVKWLKRFVQLLGIIFLISIFFSFTDIPFWAYYWLGTHNSELEIDPDVIVMLGGGGMPSSDGLLRCYFTADIANLYPAAQVFIAIPGDTALKEESPDRQVRAELILRGIDSTRIYLENQGMNTYTQANNIAQKLGNEQIDTLGFRLVTTPEHMFRSVATFRNLGYKYVGGQPTFSKDINEELLVRRKKAPLDQDKSVRALNLRYNMWNYLKYEITVLREICAITYYKLRGYI